MAAKARVKRLRIFAGPNGSGKSSVYRRLMERYSTGRYVNPDDLARQFQSRGKVNLKRLRLTPEPVSLRRYLKEQERFVQKAEEAQEHVSLRLEGNYLVVDQGESFVYTAALAAGYLRGQLTESGQSFSFESVFSDAEKLKEIQKAKEAGYRVYVYFVCTDNPDINVDRVANRVTLGEHDVPEDKIRARYVKSLENLAALCRLADRAYLFDNSNPEIELVAEISAGKIRIQADVTPDWVRDFLIGPLGASVVS